jgi:hypothetical protein
MYVAVKICLNLAFWHLMAQPRTQALSTTLLPPARSVVERAWVRGCL